MDLKEVQQYVYKGGRLKQPKGCPDDMYRLMLTTWNANPDFRPSFAQLQALFEKTFARCSQAPRDVGKLINELLAAATAEADYLQQMAESGFGFDAAEVRNSLALDTVAWEGADGLQAMFAAGKI